MKKKKKKMRRRSTIYTIQHLKQKPMWSSILQDFISIFLSLTHTQDSKKMIGQSISKISLVIVVVFRILNVEVNARLGGKRAMIDASSLASVEDVRHAAEDVLKRFHQEEVRHSFNSLSLSLTHISLSHSLTHSSVPLFKAMTLTHTKTVGSRFRRRFAGERCR